MSPDLQQGFRFGPWTIEPLRGAITGSNGQTHHLEPKVMDVFVCLAENVNKLVSRDQLLEAVWGDNVAADALLTGAVGHLRRALQDDLSDVKYIETVPKRGYRLIGQIGRFDGAGDKKPGSEVKMPSANRPRLLLAGTAVIALLTVLAGWNAGRIQEWLRGAGETSSAMSIAVLPFVNMTSDPQQEYFSDGLTEDILNLLTQIPELRVTSRTSAFSFKGKDFRTTNIGRTLKVDHILEGGVQKSGDTVRITAQLIDVATDTHLWSESWNRKIDDVFAVQDEIARAVVAALKIKMIGSIPRSLQTTPEAFALYLQGRSLMFQRSAANLLKAETLLKSALDIDSSYVPAWVQLGETYLLGVGSVSWTPHDGYPRARAAAMEALRLDADNAKAHALLAWISRAYYYDIAAARRELEIATALAPHDSVVLVQAVASSIVAGEYDAAIRISQEAEKLDPLYPFIKRLIGHSYFSARRFDEAIFAYRASIALNPAGNGGLGTLSLGQAMLASGDHDAALREFNTLQQDAARFAGRALVFQAMGDSERSSAELNALIAVGDGWDVTIARVHAYRGELIQAFERLNRAIDLYDPALTFMSGDPFFDNLRGDPRFDMVLERIGHKAL